MALSTSRTLITKTGISTTQVFDMGGINIAGGDFNLGSAIKLGNASGIITATTFSGSLAASNLTGALPAISGASLTGVGHSFGNSSVNTTGIITAARIVSTIGTFTGDTAISGSLQIADTIQHEGDVNTKIRFPAADQFSVETGGSERFRINGNGATVTGVATITGDTGNARLDLHSTASGTGSQVKFHNDHATSFVGISGDTDGNLLIFNQSNTDIIFSTNNNNRSRIDSNGHFVPETNNTFDLGSTTLGWRNVYMNDLNLSNMKGDTNDVDGTQGSWTIQEGKDDLYIINRLNGKKFKIKMEEIS